MYKCPTRRELLEGRLTKPELERIAIALEHICDILVDDNNKRLNGRW